MENLPIVVYSDERWSGAQPRQQQLLARVAGARRLIYFERAARADAQVPDSTELSFPLPNVIVARPILQGEAAPFDAARIGDVARRLLHWQHADRHVAWVCTPLAVELARALAPEHLVYDCAD